MNTEYTLLQERKKYLECLIRKKEQALGSAPPGYLKIRRQNGNAYCYHVLPGPSKEERYLPHEQAGLVCALAQKGYDRHVLTAARKEYFALKNALHSFPPVCAEDIYDRLSTERQRIVTPVVPSDSMIIERWMQISYEPKPFLDTTSEFFTEKGERVRSKSEILIGNTLLRLGIPYKYECPLTLRTGKIIYPDFTLLDVANRRQLYLEHLGMMDDSYYSEAAASRILEYEQNDIFPGTTLILSWETRRNPLNLKNLTVKLQHYLKKRCAVDPSERLF